MTEKLDIEALRERLEEPIWETCTPGQIVLITDIARDDMRKAATALRSLEARVKELERERDECQNLAERSAQRLAEATAPGSIGAFAARDAMKARAEAAEAERDDLQATFDLRWKADMRAIAEWRDVTGQELTMPDHVDLVHFLMMGLDLQLKNTAAAEEDRNSWRAVFKRTYDKLMASDDEVSRLAARLEAAERVLEPFARVADALEGEYGFEPDKPVNTRNFGPPNNDFPPLVVGHLRAARDFMKEAKRHG